MLKIILICAAIMVGSNAVPSSYSSSSSGGFASSGGSSGNGYYDPYAPSFPFSPFIDPTDFHNALTQQIQSQHNQHQSAVAMTFASPGASVFATASLFPDDELIQQQFARQQAFFDVIQRQTQAQHAAAAASGAYAPNYATSNAGYGGGKYYQSASINPSNPKIPNIVNRFSSVSSSPGNGKGSFHGVSTSAFSDSSNVNGVHSSRRGASTVVNDNGKITAYHVHS